jgi:hypothetical protein
MTTRFHPDERGLSKLVPCLTGSKHISQEHAASRPLSKSQMRNIKFEPRHLVNATDGRRLLLKVHCNAFDTRTSFVYDRHLQTLHDPARERMEKE